MDGLGTTSGFFEGSTRNCTGRIRRTWEPRLSGLLFATLLCWQPLLGMGALFGQGQNAGPDTSPMPSSTTLHWLALGDSYTIGESVRPQERWPSQLAARVEALRPGVEVKVEYRARTGWTTTNLLSSLGQQAPSREHYELVTLLIGVNNQFRGVDFAVYTREAQRLLDLALQYAGGEATRVLVLSIPDYTYTPYGQQVRGGSQERIRISTELDEYNAWMRQACLTAGLPYVDITQITRQGLRDTALVARDGLHPSAKAYAAFVDAILAQAPAVLKLEQTSRP